MVYPQQTRVTGIDRVQLATKLGENGKNRNNKKKILKAPLYLHSISNWACRTNQKNLWSYLSQIIWCPEMGRHHVLKVLEFLHGEPIMYCWVQSQITLTVLMFFIQIQYVLLVCYTVYHSGNSYKPPVAFLAKKLWWGTNRLVKPSSDCCDRQHW